MTDFLRFETSLGENRAKVLRTIETPYEMRDADDNIVSGTKVQLEVEVVDGPELGKTMILTRSPMTPYPLEGEG